MPSGYQVTTNSTITAKINSLTTSVGFFCYGLSVLDGDREQMCLGRGLVRRMGRKQKNLTVSWIKEFFQRNDF
jgi:hypothetical protein